LLVILGKFFIFIFLFLILYFFYFLYLNPIEFLNEILNFLVNDTRNLEKILNFGSFLFDLLEFFFKIMFWLTDKQAPTDKEAFTIGLTVFLLTLAIGYIIGKVSERKIYKKEVEKMQKILARDNNYSLKKKTKIDTTYVLDSAMEDPEAQELVEDDFFDDLTIDLDELKEKEKLPKIVGFTKRKE